MIFGKRNSDLTDGELVYKYQKTQNAKFIGPLFDRYGGLSYGVCMKYLKNQDDCKDAVIQIFEKVMEDLKRMKVTHFKSWLYMVTKNHCLMELRKRKISTSPIDDMYVAAEEEIDITLFLNKEAKFKDLDLALLDLKTQQRECILLFYIEEMSYKEIEQNTGYTLKEIKSNIQNGKRNLKIVLESETAQRKAL